MGLCKMAESQNITSQGVVTANHLVSISYRRIKKSAATREFFPVLNPASPSETVKGTWGLRLGGRKSSATYRLGPGWIIW